ncbi:hypothetical protein ACU6ZU_04085 [Klebsiella aerogenes]
MMVIAIAATLILYAYWYACRAAALDEKEKLSKVTIDYLDDESAPAKMKDMAYFAYLGAGKWWFFPTICVLAPIVLLLTKEQRTAPSSQLINKGEKASFQDVMDSIVAVNMKRHPLMSMFFAAVAILLSVIAILTRITFGGIKKIPTFSSSILHAIDFMHTFVKKSHP